eukprot:GSChrysophyteH1.ASY1.ANO1.1313.1 assembled CDS
MSKHFIPHHSYITCRDPTAKEKAMDLRLKSYMSETMALETDKEMKRRDKILNDISKLFKAFVIEVATTKDVGADIDTICVAPNFVTREHFFTILKEKLMNHKKVTDFSSIETANVPIMAFDYDGISIDLLFARLASNTVKKDFDILDDRILSGIDAATEKSLNGPRVTNMIPKLANKAKDADGNILDHDAFPETFLIVLRCIRKWAKIKGLYGNKMGYLGGINCNLLVASVCQLFPRSSPSTLLRLFFQTYAGWKWPNPVMLNAITPNPPELREDEKRDVWDPVANSRDLMPIITPAYPAMNSSMSVNENTRQVMEREFQLGWDVCRDIVKGNATWDKLFEPSDFFIRYNHYLSLNIVGTGDNLESRSWMGFVESYIRGFPQYLRVLPVENPIHLYPVQSKTAKSANSVCYFVGFNVDRTRFKPDKPLNIEAAASRFQDFLVNRYEGRNGALAPGLDFFVDYHAWKKLPKGVFDPLGGRDAAKEKRKLAKYGKYANTEEPGGSKNETAGDQDGEGTSDKEVAVDNEETAPEAADTEAAAEEAATVEDTASAQVEDETLRSQRKRKLESGEMDFIADHGYTSRRPLPSSTIHSDLPVWKSDQVTGAYAHPKEVIWQISR